MKVLVTGGAGFVASHLIRELTTAGYDVWLTDCQKADLPNYRKADLTDADAIFKLVDEVRPDAVVHLGAISFVPDAAQDRKLLERVNEGGTQNVLNALVAARLPRRFRDLPQFLFVSTAQVYMRKSSAYAMSKMSGEAMVFHYCHEGVDGVIARPANHTGPGQNEKFVVPSFIRQALEIKAGHRRCFTVGNLDSVRDFTDVRDVVRAYRLLLEKGVATGVYAIGTSNYLTMRELLAKVAKMVGVPVDYEVDPVLWRPTDVSVELDTTPIRGLGWEPQFTLDETLADMIVVRKRTLGGA